MYGFLKKLLPSFWDPGLGDTIIPRFDLKLSPSPRKENWNSEPAKQSRTEAGGSPADPRWKGMHLQFEAIEVWNLSGKANGTVLTAN